MAHHLWSVVVSLLGPTGAVCAVLCAAAVVVADAPPPAPPVPPDPVVAVEVPGTRGYTWSDDDVRSAVRHHLVALTPAADQAVGSAVLWPPPDHPDAVGYADPPAVAPWVPGAWLVETGSGRWWVLEAYGSVSPADDPARAVAEGD